ncbi:MAG: hypothetical protein JJE39_00480 [Vicinamibacteria bacterium]|nr:hypothetical protein [Vicinamibacteria bacterium]
MNKGGLSLVIAMTALVAALLLLAPRGIRGLAADKWVTYYAAQDGLPRPRRASARALVVKTDIAMRNLAPLPQASAAAMLALTIAQRAQGEGDRESALIIYRGVRASCARVRSQFLSGAGFAVIEARAAALEQSAAPGAPK